MGNPTPPSGALRLLATCLAALVLGSCASTTVVREEPAPRSAHAAQRPAAAAVAGGLRGPSYTVQPGDTLYGIAFRNSLDWREVARWNGIGEPFVIRPGQVLRLSAPSAPRVASGPPPIPRGPAGSSTAPVTTPVPVPASRPASVPTPSAPVAAAPPRQPPVAPVAPAVPAPTAAPTAVPATTPTGPAGSGAFRPGQWQWPTQGQVISRYAEGDKARQGIAIAGTAGQPVRAAAAGTVVYSGAGLVGYGELIIIKHNDEWLSAYGHNRRRLVAEGASISAGQQIAELGRTGTSRDMLHFEIRRNGKPVDPAPLLPRR